MEELEQLAERCDRSYRNPNGKDLSFRYVDPFWFEGGLLGLIDTSDDEVAYVVFRGTSEVGNWFLTNAQAYETAGKAITSFGDVDGYVHQGLLRAFSYLWFGRDIDFPQHARTWTKYLLGLVLSLELGLPVLGVLWVLGVDLKAHWRWHGYYEIAGLWIILAGVVVGLQKMIEDGVFEHGFSRRKMLELGRPLSEVLREVTRAQVVFTGHSLGGAVATLAFVEHSLNGSGKASLVTFGAPRLGNDKFARWFHAKFEGRYRFLAHKGDAVAHIPPSSQFLSDALRRPTFLGVCLSIVYLLFWVPYQRAYGLGLGSGWRRRVSWAGESGFRKRSHSLEAYRETIRSGVFGNRRLPGGALIKSGEPKDCE